MVALITFIPIKIMKRLALYFYPTEEKKLKSDQGYKSKNKVVKFIEKYLLCRKNELRREELY